MNSERTPTRWQDPAVIERVTTQARTVAVVGVSPDPTRPSHGVAAYLHRNGLRVYPVNPAITELFGLTAYPSLADLPEPVDIVDVFRRPEYVTAIAEQAVAAGAGALWLQLGVINTKAATLAEAGGLDVVMDKRLRVEHARLLSR
ncbi:MAG TPA: CoA-binding protein [Pseudonocardiaceae bacterium]